MEELNSILEKTKDQSKMKEQDEILLQPFAYIQQIPGKQFRSELALAFNHWLHIPAEKLHQIGEIVQMMHNSSLLLDDIEDNSILRRGVPVAHSIYGVASTINAANYALCLSILKVQQLGHPEGNKVCIEQLLELHRGQGMEIYWRDSFTCPSESDYKLMTIRKTGGLFMLAIRLMQLFSDNKEDYSKLSSILGLYFQIRDDYCNLSLKEYTENKSFAEDLTEGKFGFPVIHAVRTQKQDKQVLHILRQRTRDVEVKKYCIKLLEKLGSFKYTREVLEKLDKQARAEVARLGPNPYMDVLLNKLLSWKSAENHTGMLPRNVKESVKATLQGGVRYGYIQRRNRRYLSAPMELGASAEEGGGENAPEDRFRRRGRGRGGRRRTRSRRRSCRSRH